MDKIRKIVDWIWRSKERVVLVIVVLVLCARVMEVVKKPADRDPFIHRPPIPITDSKDPDVIEMLGLPGDPSRPPGQSIPEVRRALWERNTFWYNAASGAGDANEGEDLRNPGIWLLQIQKLGDDKLRARLATNTIRDWYDEGESFLQYKLISIDAEQQQCVVYSEELRRRLTLKKQ